MYNDKLDEHFAHYGVLGMKWGIRKATKKGKRVVKKQDHSPDQKDGLTDKQKKILKGVAIAVGATLATYGAYKLGTHVKYKLDAKATRKFMDELYKQDRLKYSKVEKMIDVGKTKLAPIDIDLKDSKTGFAKIMSKDVGIAKINKFDLYDQGSTMNCGNSTIALELRKRGLDVKATPNPTGMTMEQMAQYFKLKGSNSIKTIPFDETKIPRGKKMEAFNKMLASMYKNENARGSLMIPHNHGNHFIGYEVKNGKVILEDAQNPLASIKNLFENVNTKTNPYGKTHEGIRIMRLDDAEVNTSVIREVTTSAREGFVDMMAKPNQIFNVDRVHGPGFVMNNYIDNLVKLESVRRVR